MADAPTPTAVTPAATTTATTVVSVPAPTPAPAPSYSQWDVAGLVVGGAIALIVAVNAILGAIDYVRNWNKSKNDQDKERDAPMESRIKILEDQCRTFRSQEYLDREFNRVEQLVLHEKGNRQQITDGLSNHFRGLASTQADDQRELVRIKTQVEGMASNALRVETAIERLSERIDERMDRMQEFFSPRKS